MLIAMVIVMVIVIAMTMCVAFWWRCDGRSGGGFFPPPRRLGLPGRDELGRFLRNPGRYADQQLPEHLPPQVSIGSMLNNGNSFPLALQGYCSVTYREGSGPRDWPSIVRANPELVVAYDGAFYAFLKINPEFAKNAGITGPSLSWAMAEFLIKNARIGCVPGVDFGANSEGYLRFCTCRSREELTGALASMKAALAGVAAR